MINFRGHQYRQLKRRAIPDEEDEYQDVGFTDQGRWGNAGSGCLFTTGERILLLKRSWDVEEPGTWGLPGGAIPEDCQGDCPDALQSALQETQEELGSVPAHKVVDQYVYQEPGFQYTTFICQVDEPAAETNFQLNWENTNYGWFSRRELASLDLHFGVEGLLEHLDPFAARPTTALTRHRVRDRKGYYDYQEISGTADRAAHQRNYRRRSARRDAAALRRPSARSVAHQGRVPQNLGHLIYRVSIQVPTDLQNKVVPGRRRAVGSAIDRLADNPFPTRKTSFGKLKDGATLWRTYSGNYRIFHTVHLGEIRVLGVRPKDKRTYKNLNEFQTRYTEMNPAVPT